jgi:hypothetical protein
VRYAAARALGQARADAGLAQEGGTVLRLGHRWDDLEPSQQRAALAWTFAIPAEDLLELDLTPAERAEKPDSVDRGTAGHLTARRATAMG